MVSRVRGISVGHRGTNSGPASWPTWASQQSEPRQQPVGIVASMSADQRPHDEMVGRLVEAGWELVGQRNGHYVRYRPPDAPPWAPSVLVPTAPDAPDYDELLDAAEAVIAQIVRVGTNAQRAAGGKGVVGN